MTQRYKKFFENEQQTKVISILKQYKEINSYSIKDNFLFIYFKGNIPSRGSVISIGKKDTLSGQELKNIQNTINTISPKLITKLKTIIDIEDYSIEDSLFIVSNDLYNFSIKKWVNS